jgi:hypothetical protein
LKRRIRSRYMRAGAVRSVPLGIARGLRLVVDPRASAHIYLGTVEIEIARDVRRLAKPGTRCYDVGSHNAYYSMIFARLTGEPVVSFEFDPLGIERMRANLALNSTIAPLIDIHEVYVAYETNPAAGADTLDAIVAREKLVPPDLLKIDVEGAEAGVLRGAGELLRRRPHLIIETHGAAVERDCIDILERVGYRPRIVNQRRWLREHRAADNRWLIAEGSPRPE